MVYLSEDAQGEIGRCLLTLTFYDSRYFPPAETEKETADTTSKDSESEGVHTESATPDLPNVPTKEPTEPGQPDAKKVKLDDAA